MGRNDTETTMKRAILRYTMAAGLAAMTLGAKAPATDDTPGTMLDETDVRAMLGVAAAYHYKTTRGRSVAAACYRDPQRAGTMRCAWRSSRQGGAGTRLREEVRTLSRNQCKQAGGDPCVELYRNGTLKYEGLPADEAERLRAALASMTTKHPPATPLPDGTTVRAGLFQERFAQMRRSSEKWRARRKNKRQYAICANAQGSGAGVGIRGPTVKIEDTRETCALACRAIAQWEGTHGTCHSLYENGEFTSAAAERAMRLEPGPVPATMRNALVGAWTWTDNRGNAGETVIERLGPDGGAAGTVCTEYRNGSLAWRRLDEAAFVNGDRLSAMNAKVRTTLMLDAGDGGGTRAVLTWPNGAQSRTPAQAARHTPCSGRFREPAEAWRAREREPDTAAIVGAWTGTWKNGLVAELGVEALGPHGTLTGRYCERASDGGVQVWDIGSGRRFEASADAKGRKAKLTIPWGDGLRNELRFTRRGMNKITMRVKQRAGTSSQKTSTLKMRRGASEDGCLLRTTSVDAADTR